MFIKNRTTFSSSSSANNQSTMSRQTLSNAESKTCQKFKKKKKICNKQKIQCFFRGYHIYFTSTTEYLIFLTSAFLYLYSLV